MKKFLCEFVRRLHLLRATLKGVKVGQGVYLSVHGKLDIARTARVELGSSVSIFKRYRIEAGERAVITLGNHVHFREGARLFAGEGAKITIADGCYFNHDVSIVAIEEVTIDRDCLFGPLCYLSDNNHGVAKGVLIQRQPQQTQLLAVGSDVWLGVGATLLKGSSVGDGAVIAARAVVTRYVPPNEIWGGIPAKRIGERRAG